MKPTDKQAIEAARVLKEYCKVISERDNDCEKCVFFVEVAPESNDCVINNFDMPGEWHLPQLPKKKGKKL